MLSFYVRLRVALTQEHGVTVVEYIALAAIVLIMLGVIVAVLDNSASQIGEALADSFDQQIKTWQ